MPLVKGWPGRVQGTSPCSKFGSSLQGFPGIGKAEARRNGLGDKARVKLHGRTLLETVGLEENNVGDGQQ